MPEQEEVTLISILSQAKQVSADYESYEIDSNNQITHIENLVAELDTLLAETKDLKDRNVLLQYKSTLYQVRSGIQSEIKEMKDQMKVVAQIEGAVEKAIKWNIGDIF